MTAATGGIPQIEQTYENTSIFILHDLYSRKSCHMHSPLPVTLQMHSAQTVMLLATSTSQPSTETVSTRRLYSPATPCGLQGICKVQACHYRGATPTAIGLSLRELREELPFAKRSYPEPHSVRTQRQILVN